MSVIGYIAQHYENVLNRIFWRFLERKHKYAVEHWPNLFCQYPIITVLTEENGRVVWEREKIVWVSCWMRESWQPCLKHPILELEWIFDSQPYSSDTCMTWSCVCFRTSWRTFLWPRSSTVRPWWTPAATTPSWRWCVKSPVRANRTCTCSSAMTSRSGLTRSCVCWVLTLSVGKVTLEIY